MQGTADSKFTLRVVSTIPNASCLSLLLVAMPLQDTELDEIYEGLKRLNVKAQDIHGVQLIVVLILLFCLACVSEFVCTVSVSLSCLMYASVDIFLERPDTELDEICEGLKRLNVKAEDIHGARARVSMTCSRFQPSAPGVS